MNSDEKRSSGNNEPPLIGEEDARSSLPKLDTDYGIPNFAFDDDKPKQEASWKRGDQKDALAEVEANLDIPLNDGTGWENGDKVSMFLITETEEEPAKTEPETDISHIRPQTEATVMPFPGSTIPRTGETPPRAVELEPSEMLRGAEDNLEPDIFEPSPESLTQSLSDFDRKSSDSIADAVQSALQNVYGGDYEAPAEATTPDFSQFSVAESLRQDAAAQAAGADDWQEDAEEFADEHTGAVGAETDTVLDYLYSNRRSGQDEFIDEPAGPSLNELSGFGATSADSGSGGYYNERRDSPGQPNFDAYHDDAEWSPPSFVTSSSAKAPGHYPAPMPTTASPESLVVGSPDSSHLLGAAGLGLIGGIALAGVLAVFVFNSFVDETDPGLSAGISSKVVERLDGGENSAGTVITQQGSIESEIPGPNTAGGSQEDRAAALQPEQPEAPQSVPVTNTTPDITSEPLTALDVSGLPGTEIQLAIHISNFARQEAALISLKGLPESSKLSTGIDVGAGQWLLPPARLETLSVTMPEAITGNFNLEVQLLKDDAQTPLTDPVTFRLNVGKTIQRSETTNAIDNEIGIVADTSGQATQLVEVTEETPAIETDNLTQLLIRDGNKLMRDGDIIGARRLYEQAAANGNPEAALAMGRSFDPSYFEKLPIRTGTPDPATAFQWYKQALDGGLVTARVKIDGLKQWLQR
jgi:hypothetical protein